MIKELSVVCPSNTAGLPIGYGVAEALRVQQTYWAESDSETGPMRFRQFLEPHKGEKALLVDDVLRSGKRFTELRALLESRGAQVVGLAVAVYQPNPTVADFGNLPLFYLAKLDAMYYKDAASCELCRRGVPVEKVWT